MVRSVTVPRFCVIAVAKAVLTLVEFTQAARVAKGADRRRLPAAPALHPTLCRPVPLHASWDAELPRATTKSSWRVGKAATFPGRHCSAHTRTAIRQGSDAGAPPCNSYLLSCIVSPSSWIVVRIQKFRAWHIYNSPPHASVMAEQIGEGEGGSEAERK